MAKPKRKVENFRVCARCRKATFVPEWRDVRSWPLIPDYNASEHCEHCWFALAKEMGGRPLGKVA